jgi:hypothetical protein
MKYGGAVYKTKVVHGIKAVQWLGNNYAEIQDFVRIHGGPRAYVSATGTTVGIFPRFWCEKSNAELPLELNGYLIAERDGVGVYPCIEEQFNEKYELDDVT